MSDGPSGIVHGLLTALFAVAALHALLHGVRSPGRGARERVDHLLHFAMAVAMAAMPWSPGWSLSGRKVTILFTAAAVWFPLTALRRRAADTVAAAATRLPPAAGMAAMAWMSHFPPRRGGHSHRTPPGDVPAAHSAAAVGHAAGASATAAVVTGLLTVCLLVHAIRSLNPMPPLRSAGGIAHGAATADPYGHLRDGAVALGTAVMLLMHH